MIVHIEDKNDNMDDIITFLDKKGYEYWVEEREKMVRCFNKDRIKDLKDKWQQYNLGWDSKKDNIPVELYEIIEELVNRC